MKDPSPGKNYWKFSTIILFLVLIYCIFVIFNQNSKIKEQTYDLEEMQMGWIDSLFNDELKSSVELAMYRNDSFSKDFYSSDAYDEICFINLASPGDITSAELKEALKYNEEANVFLFGNKKFLRENSLITSRTSSFHIENISALDGNKCFKRVEVRPGILMVNLSFEKKGNLIQIS